MRRAVGLALALLAPAALAGCAADLASIGPTLHGDEPPEARLILVQNHYRITPESGRNWTPTDERVEAALGPHCTNATYNAGDHRLTLTQPEDAAVPEGVILRTYSANESTRNHTFTVGSGVDATTFQPENGTTALLPTIHAQFHSQADAERYQNRTLVRVNATNGSITVGGEALPDKGNLTQWFNNTVTQDDEVYHVAERLVFQDAGLVGVVTKAPRLCA